MLLGRCCTRSCCSESYAIRNDSLCLSCEADVSVVAMKIVASGLLLWVRVVTAGNFAACAIAVDNSTVYADATCVIDVCRCYRFSVCVCCLCISCLYMLCSM